MKKSKQENPSEIEDAVDRISNLPDPILQIILSGLPTSEEVIRTSILSSRWRYLWASLPFIDIDCSCRSKSTMNTFKRFVDHSLASSSLDLDSFRLSCSSYYNQSTIWQWVQAAVNRNIKQLHLLFGCGSWPQCIKLPDFLVNCDSLEVLRLSLSEERLLRLPKVTGFRALRVLELNDIELSHQHFLLEKFLKSIPLLEELSLIDCDINQLKVLYISCQKLKNLRLDNRNIFDPADLYDRDTLCRGIVIICPNLVFFEFGAFVALRYNFFSLGSLKTAVVHPEGYDLLGQFMDYGMWYPGASNLEYLSTSIQILCGDLSEHLPPSYGPPLNLKTLKLTTVDANTQPPISKLISILKCLNHLESLHLIIDENYFFWEDWKLDEEDTRSILIRHLKKVEFINFENQTRLLDVARSLLEHGNALEEMVFRWDCDEAKFHEKSMETMNQVSNFHKASSIVKLLFLNEISYYQLSN